MTSPSLSPSLSPSSASAGVWSELCTPFSLSLEGSVSPAVTYGQAPSVDTYYMICEVCGGVCASGDLSVYSLSQGLVLLRERVCQASQHLTTILDSTEIDSKTILDRERERERERGAD